MFWGLCYIIDVKGNSPKETHMATTYKVTKTYGNRKMVKLHVGDIDSVWAFAKRFAPKWSAPVMVERMAEDGKAWEKIGVCWF